MVRNTISESPAPRQLLGTLLRPLEWGACRERLEVALISVLDVGLESVWVHNLVLVNDIAFARVSISKSSPVAHCLTLDVSVIGILVNQDWVLASMCGCQ